MNFRNFSDEAKRDWSVSAEQGVLLGPAIDVHAIQATCGADWPCFEDCTVRPPQARTEVARRKPCFRRTTRLFAPLAGESCRNSDLACPPTLPSGHTRGTMCALRPSHTRKQGRVRQPGTSRYGKENHGHERTRTRPRAVLHACNETEIRGALPSKVSVPQHVREGLLRALSEG